MRPGRQGDPFRVSILWDFIPHVLSGSSRTRMSSGQAVAATSRQVIQGSGIRPEGDHRRRCLRANVEHTPVDEKGQPLTPMLSWLDLRSVKQADRLFVGDMPKFLFDNTGNIPTAKDSIPKILWLKEERPEILEKDRLLAGLQGIHPVQADRQDCHRSGGGLRSTSCSTLIPSSGSEEVCHSWTYRSRKLPPFFPCTDVIGEVHPCSRQTDRLEPGHPGGDLRRGRGRCPDRGGGQPGG